LKIVGYSERVNVAAQMNSRMTTSSDEKSKRALIINPNINECDENMLDLSESSLELMQ